MTLDPAYVYWTNLGDGGANAGSVMSVLKAGGAPTPVAVGQTHPYSVAVDSAAVYWTSAPNVMSAALGGGAPTALATGTRPYGVTLDANYIYWSEQNNGAAGQTMATALADGTTHVISSTGSNPERVVVTATNIYDSLYASDLLQIAPLVGGAVKTFVPYPQAGQDIGGVARDATNLYCSINESGGEILACPLDTTKCTKIGVSLNGATALATDGVYVYILSPYGGVGATTGVVRRLPVGGGASEVIAVTPGHDTQDIAVDDTSVYWITKTTGNVMKLTPK